MQIFKAAMVALVSLALVIAVFIVTGLVYYHDSYSAATRIGDWRRIPLVYPWHVVDYGRENSGVKLEDCMTAPALVDLVGYDYEKNLTRFNVTIHEGRNRQVRRMCDYIGFPVRYLRRVQMGTLTLDGLRRGDCRELFNEEIDALRVACGLKREVKAKRNAEPKQEVKAKRNAEVKQERKAED